MASARVEHYCCFAIPLYNVGIYSILSSQSLLGLLTAILSFGAPSILAIALPGYLSALFGTLCLLIGCVQSAGFYAVCLEKVAVFRKYLVLNAALIVTTILYSLVLIILSATRHAEAIELCLVQFVGGIDNPASEQAPSQSGRSVCNTWTWAQLSVCTVLWLVMGASQLYFCYMEKIWSQDQKLDHLRYKAVVSAVRDSLLENGAEEWESPSRSASMDIPPDEPFSTGNNSNKPPIRPSRLRQEIPLFQEEHDVARGSVMPARSPSGGAAELNDQQSSHAHRGGQHPLEQDSHVDRSPHTQSRFVVPSQPPHQHQHRPSSSQPPQKTPHPPNALNPLNSR